jgi:hypothetical protein
MNAVRRARLASGGVSLGEALLRAGVPQRIAEREADERRNALVANGYGDVAIEVRGPRLVIASTHKVDSGARAEALGIDRIDAERKLVSLVTRR